MKINSKKASSNSGNRYQPFILEMVLAAFLSGLIVISGILTSGFVIPKTPFGRPDFWPGVVVLSLFFLKTWKGRLFLIITFPLIFLSFELSSYAGIGDYAISMFLPLQVLTPIVFYKPKKFKFQLTFALLTLIFYIFARYLAFSLSSILFYKTSFVGGLVYNGSNIGLDFAASIPILSFGFIKLIKFHRK